MSGARCQRALRAAAWSAMFACAATWAWAQPASTREDAPPDGAPVAERAPAAPVQVRSEVEPAEVKLGDVVTLRVYIDHEEGVDVRFPGKPSVGAGFRYRSHSRRAAEGEAGGSPEASPDAAADGPPAGSLRQVIEVELVAARMGRQRIPGIELAWVRGEQSGTLRTPKQLVRVRTRMAAEIAPALRGPGAPRPLHQPNTPLIWSLIIGGVALGAALLTLLAVRVLGPRLRGEPEPPPPRPAHEVAYERLATLSAEAAAEQGAFKAFYLELSAIVREYFGNRYAIEALGDTTTELMEALSAVRPQGIGLSEVESFLDESDLVKFAKFTPSRNDMETALVTAQLFVDRTREEARERKQDDREDAKGAAALPGAPAAKRALAFGVDLLVGAVPLTLLVVAARPLEADWLRWLALGLLATWLLLRDSPRRGSVGKRLAGLRLAAAGDGQGPAPLGRRALRNAPLLLPVAGLVAEAVWMRFDPDGHRIGDRLAATCVLDARPERPGGAAWAGAAACAMAVVALVVVLVIYSGGA